MDWRSDMENAPKNGQSILLGYFLEGGGGGDPVVAWWHSSRRLWCDSHRHYRTDGYFSPTHWMPLPKAPK